MKSQPKNLEEILHAHSLWLLSERTYGRMANFDGWNLDGAAFEMANLSFARFQSASLRGAVLEGANLRQAKLARANLKEARLAGADFEGADISGADLSFAECEEANFINANLEGINFQGANLNEASFLGANLRHANFKNADLSYAEMNGANLEEAKFDGANLEGIDFLETNLEITKLEKTSFEGTHQKGFDLEPTISQRVNLELDDYMNLILDEEASPNTEPANHNSEKPNSNQRPYTKESKDNLFVDSPVVDQGMTAEAVGAFIKKVKSKVDPNQIKKICKTQYGIEKIDKIDFKGGDIVALDDQAAFKLDFKISAKLELFIDSRGKITITLPQKYKEAPST